MLNIPPQPNHRGVLGVVVRDGRFLMIRRSATVVAPGMIGFPGGGIESGETEPEALIREFHEELGVAVEPIRPLWQSVTPWQVRLSWWLAALAVDARPEPNPAEVASFDWLSPAEIAALDNGLPSNRDFLAALAAGRIRLEP